ncbi:MAG: DegT/DnrJ/EryC1/StrS family aminotransferase [Candidatus Sericytochromatia bacterium]
MSQAYIPFHRYSFNHLEEEAMIQTLRSGWITRGPQVEAFEKSICEYTHAKHALGLNSCTAGLHLALLSLDLQPGDEVITTPLTFVATVNMIVRCGATPVLADIDPNTLNISIEAIKKALTPKTRAIIPVHLGGQPCNMNPIMDLAKAHNLFVIEDAAHAIGAEYQGQRIGTIADVTVFSFYANKNITTGEGGMLTTQNAELMERLRPLALHGLSKDAWKRFSEGGYQHYLVEEPGFKYNMTDIQAALGNVQLAKCDELISARRKAVDYYKSHLRSPLLRIPSEIADIRNPHHLFMILLQTEALKISRDQLIGLLHQKGIGTAVHYIPIHFHPFYQRLLPDAATSLPVATDLAQRTLSLPLFPALTESEQDYIIENLETILSSNKK